MKLFLKLLFGGIFLWTPVLGSPSILCLLADVVFRVNAPAIQLVNYFVYLLQFALLIPFLRMGEWIFTARPASLAVAPIVNLPGADEVPMIGGMARLGKWFSDGGMRKGTPRQDHENVITVYGGTDLWKQRLALPVTECRLRSACRPARRVRWRHSGEFDEKAYDLMTSQVADLLK